MPGIPLKNKKGVTLVELLISIVIISIAFYTLISVFSLVATKSGDSQTITTANYLAQGKMEEWMAKGYRGVGLPITPTWTSFNDVVGENGSILNYQGQIQFQAYGYQVYVSYIDSSVDPIVEITSGGVEGANMKKVKVVVRKGVGPSINLITTLSCILSPE